MTPQQLHLTLPLPPSPNTVASHHMEKAREKNAYRKRCWIQALKQAKPKLDPPELVVLTATFYVQNPRDEDNLAASLKWVLDTLKRDQTGKMRWRSGIADRKGYFRDDDPEHLKVAGVSQEIDRGDSRLEVVLRWKGEE